MGDFAERLREGLANYRDWSEKDVEPKPPPPDEKSWNHIAELAQQVPNREIPNERFPYIMIDNAGGVSIEYCGQGIDLVFGYLEGNPMGFCIEILETKREVGGEIAPEEHQEAINHLIAFLQGDMAAFEWFSQRRDIN